MVLCRGEVEGTAREEQWHAIPTIEVGEGRRAGGQGMLLQVSHWPDQGFEFFLRKRTVMRDKRTGLAYQVPLAAGILHSH